jgi:mono/diheme cytochrome c family protein
MRWTWFGSLALVLAVQEQLLAYAAEQDAFIAEGRAFVEKHCGRCHATGIGDPSPHAQAPPFRLVVERYPSEHLAEGIVTGHRDMPVFELQPHEIEAFLAYLDSLGPQETRRPKDR